MDLPLLDWLQTYTFPCEAKFQDQAFARAAYERSVSRHLRSGTTMASYFATIHKEASKTLAEVLTSVGQRAFVGTVLVEFPYFRIVLTLRAIQYGFVANI